MNKYEIIFSNDYSERDRVVGSANTLVEARKIRDEKAELVIKRLGLDKEDKVIMRREVIGSKEKFVESYGHQFSIEYASR